MYNGCLTDIDGILAGHYTDTENKTGCTVVLLGDGAVTGVDVRGGAPGTRETDLLRPCNAVQNAHALLLCGGSAFGLAAADGVMRWLEGRGIGLDTGFARVPIVPAAVLFDLAAGGAKVRPNADWGCKACEAACGAGLAQGRAGAGAGATVGKAGGFNRASNGGFGRASIALPGGVIVAAGFAVNAYGDVFDHATGQKISGMEGGTVFDELMQGGAKQFFGQNTTIGIIGTNAALSKEQANKLASMGQDGIAMTVRPAHTMFDGDTVFAFGTGAVYGDLNAILAAGAEVSARAIVNAVKERI
ncbi:MAG: P1 family peptidase [Christensenellales bacterium]